MASYTVNMPAQIGSFNGGLLTKLLLTFAVIIFSGSGFSAEPAKAGVSEEVAYYGNYQVDGRFMGIDRFIMDDAKETALISDYTSGVVRRLFSVSETEFVMGPGFHTQNPAELTVRLMKDKQGVTTGLRLLRTEGTESVATRVPLGKEQVFFEQADAKLSGTLIIPPSKGPHPAIILLHGSGPLTRDSFGPYPHFFSSRGLAVLIFDKRGTGESTGLRMDASTGTVMKPAYYPDDLANDALSALHFLQQRKDIDPERIGLWGSSEGGMLATYVASKSKDVAFAINSSGFMEPLWETLQYQVEPLLRDAEMPKEVIQRQRAFVELWLKVARTGKGWEQFKKQQAELITTDGFTFFQSRGEYSSLEEMRWDWNHVLNFNPQHALAKVTCPVLGLFGELDSVTPAVRTAENMRRVLTEAKHKDFTVKVFPNAGHSLSELPTKNRMAPGVFETLSNWITSRLHRDE